jgi:DNA-directed RNA polymerase beta' subunit
MTDVIRVTEDMISPTGEEADISALKFELLSSDEIHSMSVAEIRESKLFGESSVYDPRLGVITNHTLCVTCKKNNQHCAGHPGHIDLPVGVPHPMYPGEILSYLNSFCHNCSHLLVEPEVMKLTGLIRYRGRTRMTRISAFCEKIKNCYRRECGKDRFTFYTDENKYYKYLKDKHDRIPVSSTEIENILGGISPEEARRFGVDTSCMLPINLVITTLLVLPICARPYVETSRGTCDDDLTSKYIDIVKACNKLRKPGIKEKERNDAIDTLEFHVHTLMHNYKKKARQISGRPVKCIRERLNGKDGIVRNNLSGKRCDFTARTVIGPDPRIRADEIAIPVEFAKKLTYPEAVNHINIKSLQQLVNSRKANFVIRGDKRIDLKYNLQTRCTYQTAGFLLQDTDVVLRGGKKINPQRFREATGKILQLTDGDRVAREGKILKNIKASETLPLDLQHGDVVLRGGRYIYPEGVANFCLQPRDKVFRGREELNGISLPQSREFKLQIGDVVERQLKTGDITLFNRQPSLHKGSMIARKVKIVNNTSGINGHRELRTIRMNLAQNKTYNADFDGDEMNMYLPQTVKSVAEAHLISGTAANLKSSQSSRLLLVITQDVLTGSYLLTAGEYRAKKFSEYVAIDRDTFNDALCCVDDWTIDYICNKREHIRKVLEWQGKTSDQIREFMWSGHCLVSMLFPDNFEYRYTPSNIVIVRGVMLSGVLGKASIGDSHSSIVHKLEKDYGANYTVDFISYYQYIINHWLRCRSFSIGIEDCIPTRIDEVRDEITKSFVEAHSVEVSESDPDLRERKVNNVLNGCTAVGQRISKDALQFDNSLNAMVVAGSKGSYVNIAQIRSLLGQQNVEGKRIPYTYGGRTLPYYNHRLDLAKQDEDEGVLTRRLNFESRGFVSSCFIEGLTPQEFYFHAEGGREGVIDTAIKTAQSGYIQRKLVKKMEDIVKSYAPGLVVNSTNTVVQFNYGDNFDPARLVRTNTGEMSFININNVVDTLNTDYEWDVYSS